MNKLNCEQLNVSLNVPEWLQGPKGEQGEPGVPGKDGHTPEIGSNGNWFINQVDTGKPSRGEQGVPGSIGPEGKPGKDGTNGITPTIGSNGNWYIGTENTGKPSRGEKGEQGPKGDTGLQGPKGDTGLPVTITVNGETKEQVNGNIDLGTIITDLSAYSTTTQVQEMINTAIGSITDGNEVSY